jgi:hypothetical protein
MAVTADFAGRRVRCPHCQQVIVAPAGDPASEPEGTGNAFQFGEAVTSSLEEPEPPVPDDSPVPASAKRQRSGKSPSVTLRPATASKTPANWILPILVPYAIFMTFMAIMYFMKYSRAVQDHPLETIPDLLGEFQQKQTKGTPQTRSVPLPPPDQDLPARLITTLGTPIRIGDIEVTPLSVEYRPWTGYTAVKGRPEPRARPIRNTLVLHLRLRNISRDLTFYPTDPYFDRNPKSPADKPYTLVDVGGRKYYGGLIEYLTDPGETDRTWLQGRENDDKPLGPGESRDTVLLTRPRDEVFDAIKKAKDPAVWRVHVRRGMAKYRDTEVPVSAVVGVSFTSADVKKAG